MAAYPGYPRRSGAGGFFFFLVYLIFGAYFINYTFNFIVIPSFITSLDKWIILVGGILIVIGAFNLLRLNKNRNPY